MPTKLKGLRVEEGSLVDKGANQDAHVVLFKRDSELEGPSLEEVKEEFEAVMAGVEAHLEKAGRKISGSRMSMMQEMKTMMDEASMMMQSMMDEANPKDMEETDDMKMKKGSDRMPITDEVKKGLDQEVQDYLAELEAKVEKVDELETKITELEKVEPEDIWKGVNPEVKKQFEDAKKEAEEAKEIAKAEKEARIAKEFEDKAGQFPNVGSVEDVSKMLRSAYDVSDENGKKLEETFKAANERIDVTKEIGSDNVSPSDAETKLEKMAAEKAEKDNITKEQAYAEITKSGEGRKLYEEIEAERSV